MYIHTSVESHAQLRCMVIQAGRKMCAERHPTGPTSHNSHAHRCIFIRSVEAYCFPGQRRGAGVPGLGLWEGRGTLGRRTLWLERWPLGRCAGPLEHCAGLGVRVAAPTGTMAARGVNRLQTYTKSIPIPIWYSVFLAGESWYLAGIVPCSF